MALFRRNDAAKDEAKPASSTPEARSVIARNVYCRICEAYTNFSKCWLRIKPLTKCMGCGTAWPNPRSLYEETQPSCPTCGEWLEFPGFEYGLCDVCGSKYELVEGAKPSLIPNKKQRDAMDAVGKSWRHK